jgi:hypothetical protein
MCPCSAADNSQSRPIHVECLMEKLEFMCRATTLSTMALASSPRFKSFDNSKSLSQSPSSSSERASVFKSVVADRAQMPSAACPPCLAIAPHMREVALFSCPRPKQLATPSIHSPSPLPLSTLHRGVRHHCRAIAIAKAPPPPHCFSIHHANSSAAQRSTSSIHPRHHSCHGKV